MTPRSTQRKLIEEAWERAKASKKRLIIRPTGGWSEQCLMFDDSLAQKGAELKKRTDRAEYLVLDELYFDRGHAIDWLPADLLSFHTVYLADPAVGRSSFTVVTNVTDAGLLADYLDLWFQTDNLPAKLRQIVLDYSPEKTPIPFAHLVSVAAHATGYTDDLATTMKFVQSLNELKATRGDLFAGIDLDGIAMRAVLNHLQAGRTTFEELEKVDRDWAERILENPERIIEVRYYTAVCNATRKQGYNAAAKLAQERLDEVRAKLPKEPMPYLGTMVDVAGVEAKLATLQKVLEALGGTLTLEQAEKWTADVLSHDYQFFFLLELPEIFYALGAYGRAADLVEHTLPMWTDFFGNVVNQLQAVIDASAAGGDTATAEKLKAMVPYVKRIPGATVEAQKQRVEMLRKLAATN